MRAWASACEPKHSIPRGIEAIHCKESSVGRRKRKGAAGNESRHAQARSRGKVGKLVVGQRTTGSKQQVAQSRHNNNNNNNNSFSFYSNRFDLFSLPRLLTRWFVCVCVRVPRFRLRPHQDTTRTGRVYGPAHCIWSQKCHTDAPHALPPRSRTPPAIEISGGRMEKKRGWRRGLGLSLFRVCASDDNLPRLFETRTNEDEIRSCLRSSLIEKLG